MQLGLPTANVPPPPRALTPQGERVASAFGGGKRTVGWILTLQGMVMAVAFGWGLPTDLAVDLSGKAVTARVTEVDPNTSVKYNKKRATRLAYTYTDGGERLEGSIYTVHPSLVRLAKGDAMPILISTVFPSWSRPLVEGRAFFGYLGLIMVVEVLVGLGLLLFGYLARIRARRAWTRGMPVAATVVSAGPGRVSRGSGRSGRQRSHAVTWEYALGTRRTASIDSLDPLFAPLAQGSTFTVLVDPSNPSVSVPWPDSITALPSAPRGAPPQQGFVGSL